MEVGIVDRYKLVDIADAVRKKTGITVDMTLDEIASNITSMPTADNNAKYDFTLSGSNSGEDLIYYLTTIDLSNFDTSNYTKMSDMFQNYSSLRSLDLSNFNTSNVDNMECMFRNCSSLKTLDLSNFDFSNINTYGSQYSGTYGMFDNCESLETIKLPATVTFNNSGVSFTDMFKNCTSLTSLDLSGWDISNVEYMGSMFRYCSSLTTLNLSNFNTSKVTNMDNMFYYCDKLSNLTLGNDWASNSSIKSFDLSYSPLTHDSAVDIINKLAPRSNSPVIKFSNQVGLYQSEIDVATNKGWSVSGCLVLVDADTATVGQYALIDGVISKCVYVADTPQAWGQKIFASQSRIAYSNGRLAFQWGGYGTATGITAQGIGKGLSNTNSLLAMNLKSTNGTPTIWDLLTEFRSTHSDRWFIASLEESSLYIKDVYWTSSEVTSQNAYTRNTSVLADSVKKTSYNTVYPFTYV